MSDRIVIVGAGQCAGQAVDGLRRGGFDGAIVVVGDEPHVPYQRPPLSKQFLAGEIGVERVWLRPESYYRERDVTLRLGVAAARIDRAGRRLELADGSALEFDRLLLATGARPRALDVPGRALEGVFDLRTIADVERIRPHLVAGRRLAVVGGGFIGLEVAAVARKLGLEVTVLEAADRLMARVLPQRLARWYARLHERHGVRVVTGAKVEGFDGSARLEAVRLATGELAADVAIIGIGVVPNQELAAAAGLACDDGILVDEGLATSDPAILAAGDCTRHLSPTTGERLRLESVPNAVSQARVAAANLAGGEATYDELPWFWSDQYDVKLQMAGLSAGHDASVVRGDPNADRFTVFYLREGVLIAADVVNGAREFMAIRKLLPARPMPSIADLENPAIDISALARDVSQPRS